MPEVRWIRSYGNAAVSYSRVYGQMRTRGELLPPRVHASGQTRINVTYVVEIGRSQHGSGLHAAAGRVCGANFE